MKSPNLNTILLCLTLLFKYSTAQTYNPSPQTWMVDAETITCENSKNECLLVKQAGKKEFEIFNESIEGFNYEKGNVYTISVRQEIKQPPIAVGESVFKYVLVKIIFKKPVNNISTTANSSTTSNTSQKIFEVNFETVPCETDNSKTCLLVKEKGRKEFEIFNATISGFNYQPGYSYTIAVKPTTDGNYYLVNEISKKLVKITTDAFVPIENTSPNTVLKTPSGKIIQQTSIQASSTLDGKWYLRKMKEAEGSSLVTDDNVMWIQVNTFNDRLDGNGACNKFAAVVKSDLNTTFAVSKITSGFSNCGNKKMEDLFYNLLEQTNRFEIRNGSLILSNQWNFLLGFTKNPDNKEDIATTYTAPAIVKNDNKIFATNQTLTDKYVPPVYSSTTTSNSTSTISNTTTNTIDSSLKKPKTDEIKQPEIKVDVQVPVTTTITAVEIPVSKPVSVNPCDPDISNVAPVIKRWDLSVLDSEVDRNSNNVTVSAQVGKSNDVYFFNLIITKTTDATNLATLSKYTGIKGNKFYFLSNHQKSIEFIATDVSNDSVKDDVNNKITNTVKLLCNINEEDFKSIKAQFAKNPLDVINIKLGLETTIEELISAAKAKIMQDKFICFFSAF